MKNQYNVHQACRYSAIQGHSNCLNYLLTNVKDFKINDPGEDGCTLVVWSAKTKNNKALKAFLDKGLKVDTTDEHNNTALLWSAYNGYFDCLNSLLESGANIEHKNTSDIRSVKKSFFGKKTIRLH